MMSTDNRIITESYEKQQSAGYDYYYDHPPQQSSPSSTDTSSSYSVSTSRKGSLQQHPHLPRNKQSTKAGSFQKIYPLTLENVSRVQAADPSSMPLARYCSDMEKRAATADTLSRCRRPSSTASTTTKKTLGRVLQQEDTVLESPRLLPFPYHNDNHFLPTAEHDYPGGCSVVTDSSSSLANLSLHTFGSRQNVTINCSTSNGYFYYYQQRYRRQLLSPSPTSNKSSLYSAKRFTDDDDMMSNNDGNNKRSAANVTQSSSPTTTLHDNNDEVSQQRKKMRRRSSSNKNKFALVFKQNLLRFKSNSPILECHQGGNSSNTTNHNHFVSTISSKADSIVPQNLVSSTSTNDTAAKVIINKKDSSKYANNSNKTAGGGRNNNKKKKNDGASFSWFDRLWKFIKPSSFIESNNNDSNTARATTTTTISTPLPAFAATTTGPVWYSQFRCNPLPPPPSSMNLTQ